MEHLQAGKVKLRKPPAPVGQPLNGEKSKTNKIFHPTEKFPANMPLSPRPASSPETPGLAPQRRKIKTVLTTEDISNTESFGKANRDEKE